MWPLFLLPSAAFMGSFHCAAMCGPFVGYFTMGAKGGTARHHAAYHLGRLVAYLVVGLMAGILGQSVFRLAETLRFQRVAMILMGSAMILTGLAYYLPANRLGQLGNLPRRAAQFVFRLAGAPGRVDTAALLGLATSLLPCGFLYAFALVAAGSGHPARGALTMLLFWAGTLPALAGVGLITRYAGQSILRGLRQITPALLILLGLFAIWGKWQALQQLDHNVIALCQGIGIM